MDNNARMEAAIADLDSQEKPNYSATAREYSVPRKTLSDRHKGKTMSRKAATSEFRQRLTIEQEEVLISQINRLTDRSIPPTSRIVKNLAEEIIGDKLGKNWTANFIHRHQDRLKSLYLRNIDNMRTKAEYAPIFSLFYKLVKLNLLLLMF